MRDIRNIAMDLACYLWWYTANYAGSPKKQQAEEVLLEFKRWDAKQSCVESTAEDQSWDKLYDKVFSIINKESKSLSTSREQTESIVQLFKSFYGEVSPLDKLNLVIDILKTIEPADLKQ